MGTCPFTNSGGPGGKAGPCSTKSCAIYMESVKMCSFLAIGVHMIADRQARHYQEALERKAEIEIGQLDDEMQELKHLAELDRVTQMLDEDLAQVKGDPEAVETSSLDYADKEPSS